MTSGQRDHLPPNPYQRSPVKQKKNLAGRENELKLIDYYLNLTAAGQSPHLALIGQRGVGKTSLLNGTQAIAIDRKLLPVRLDMNEQKANSHWTFWRDLYQSLILEMVGQGCWGGKQGKVYSELLKMIHSRQPGSVEAAVLQLPFVMSCHQGDTKGFECPDSLVVNDFKECLSELRRVGLSGIALLIDEADCLGSNVPLLQMLRNVFQVVEGGSLVLAGTDAVFPAISSVFSPIPRQFHRIDIRPFATWTQTLDLVFSPLPKEMIETVAPAPLVVRQLHDLCGGAPDEVQLYCHHMYRSIETGSAIRMSLSPSVFREVLREYRSNSSANLGIVLNAIERLPDDLLFKSKWVARRNLTVEENILVSTLAMELKDGVTQSTGGTSRVGEEIRNGYLTLFDAGIIEQADRICLAGAPLSAAFWKSFVEVERGQRWIWDDRSFAGSIAEILTFAAGQSIGSGGPLPWSRGGEAIRSVEALRAGRIPNNYEHAMVELISATLVASEKGATHVADVSFDIDSPAGKRLHRVAYLEPSQTPLTHDIFEKWVTNTRERLSKFKIHVTLSAFESWALPSAEELHRLARISEHPIPKAFGPSQDEQALKLFEDGDIPGCISVFSKMLDDKEDGAIRNNLGFCQILSGNPASGLENVRRANATEYEPLYALNVGVAQFLLGKKNEARESLRGALEEIRLSRKRCINQALYVLVLEPSGNRAVAHKQIPVDAAILLNLFQMKDMTLLDLEVALSERYSGAAKEWLSRCISAAESITPNELH